MRLLKSNAFKYGEGFFTTIRVEKSTAIWLEDHIERLDRSLSTFGYRMLDVEKIKAAVYGLLAARSCAAGYLRIQVWQDQHRVAAYIEGDFTGLAAAEPCSVTTSAYCRPSSDPLVSHKSCNYLTNLQACRQAGQRGFFEAIFLNERQEVCEGSRSNLFWWRRGVLYTPDLVCGLLPGICRARVLRIALAAGIEVRAGRYHLEHLLEADEVFLTNSLRGIIPVTRLDDRKFPPGKSNAVMTRRLQDDIRAYIENR